MGRPDNTQFHFKNTMTNEIFIGTKSDFYKKYNLHKSSVYRLISNKLKTLKNWVLVI